MRTEPEAPSRRERLDRALRAGAKVALGGGLLFAGVSHLTVAREEFRAQVPEWVPVDTDAVVVWSGVAEIVLGAATLATWQQPDRARVGRVAAAFFVAVFPGNVAQWLERKDGFGLDTDDKRFARLFAQPAMVAAALYAGDGRRTRRADD